MQVFKYTDDVQKVLKSHTKPEPWLHIAYDDGYWAIYVWDTRKVLEEGRNMYMHQFGRGQLIPAKDNHQPLDGIKAKGKFRFETMIDGIHVPDEEQITDQADKWRYQGSRFFGNRAFFASHAKRIETSYARKPNFNKLVEYCIIAMSSDGGDYVGYAGGQPVQGPTFNDILFNIDRRATAKAKQILQQMK